jgi:hypothetical protein
MVGYRQGGYRSSALAPKTSVAQGFYHPAG